MKKNILVLTAFCFLKLQFFGQTAEVVSASEKTVQSQNPPEAETSANSETQTENENSSKSDKENSQSLPEEENSPQTENQENIEVVAEAENQENDNPSEENSDADDEAEEVSVKIPKKRPQKQNAEKIAELDEEFPDTRKENADTLKFGMEDDIIELLNDFVKNEDVRFVDEVYDLFYVTKNIAVREKILEYFTKLKDPCLENFAL